MEGKREQTIENRKSKIENRFFLKSSGRIIGSIAFLAVIVLSSVALRPHDTGENRSHTQSPKSPLPAAASHPDATPPSRDGSARGTKGESDSSASELIDLIGTIQPDTQAVLSVAQPARILAVAVKEGERVRHGQLLVQLDAVAGQAQQNAARAGLTATRAQLEKARTGRAAQQIKADADVDSARAGLQQAQTKFHQAILARDAARSGLTAEQAAAQENVRKAQAALDHAQQTLDSLEELAKVGGVSRNDLEGARTQVLTAQSDLNAARAQAQSLNAGPGQGDTYRIALAQQDVDAAQQGVQQAQQGLVTATRARKQTLALADRDIQAAAAAVDQAQAGLVGAQAFARSARLVSPLNGVVTGLQAHAGETAQPGVPLLTVISISDLHVEALALARQLPRLHPGQQARIVLDTRPESPLMARLDTISRVAEPDGRSFRLRFHLLNPPTDLRAGQIARVSIPTL